MKAALHYMAAIAFIVINSSSCNADERAAKSHSPLMRGLVCSPTDIRPADTIKVELPANHGTDLAIVNPRKEYFFISFKSSGGPSALKPIIPAQEFAGMRELKLNVSTATGIPWTGESVAPKNIFTISGTYTIMVAPSLETEDPELDGWCKLEFKDIKTPGSPSDIRISDNLSSSSSN
jgi:hypothetical protein